jgi:hypothetical protein
VRGGGAGGKRSAVIESQPPYIGAYIGVFIGVPTGVTCTVLLFGERRDELAAEGRDIPDHAAPDQVKMSCGRPEPISDGLLGRSREILLPRLVCSWVWREAREEAASVGVGGYWSGANLYVHAPKVLCGWDFGVCRSVRYPPLGAASGAGLYAGYWI